jgi:hypothetical protein
MRLRFIADSGGFLWHTRIERVVFHSICPLFLFRTARIDPILRQE